MFHTKPMSRICEIHFHIPTNQDANKDVLMWHAFLVKAVIVGYEHPVSGKSLHKPSLVKLCIIIFNSSKIKENNHF